jgi:dienelactone hydrolase
VQATTTTTATTVAPTTTIDPASLFDVYSEPGPYPVGVTTLTISSGIAVEVWYPAAPGTVGTETYDVRDFTAPEIKALLTADIPATVSYSAGRDAVVGEGRFPLVLNSHGFSGIRVGSSFLTSHLASWGLIVASPDHPSRDLYHAVSPAPGAAQGDAVVDLLAALDVMIAADSTPGDRFEGHVESTQVAALGHSAGGGTVLGAAQDDRVDGYVSMASGVFGDNPELAVLPNKPSFFLSGAIDQVVPMTRTADAFNAAPSPSLFWAIDSVGHNGFDDFCTVGNGTGIIGIAEASGLGPFLDAQPSFRKLGKDGCEPPAVPVSTTFPIINHAVTAWLLTLFGLCEGPQGLGPEVGDAYTVAVTIEQH